MKLPTWATDEAAYGTSRVLKPWVAMVGFLLVLALLISVIFGGAYVATRISCNQVSEQSGRVVEFRIPSGCWVQMDDGNFVPDEVWRHNTGR